MHQLQPGLSIHIAENTPDSFLEAGLKVIRQGNGYPSVFNPDTYVQELVRQGKTLEDAREGGCSGCIEVGAFGKEAYLLTGYLNTPKTPRRARSWDWRLAIPAPSGPSRNSTRPGGGRWSISSI